MKRKYTPLIMITSTTKLMINVICRCCNEHLEKKLKNADLLISHSYFMHKNIDALPEIMNHKVIPLLYEYFYDKKQDVINAVNDALKGYTDRFGVETEEFGRIYVKPINSFLMYSCCILCLD